MQFKGSIPALITPMLNGAVDEKALKKLVNWHIEEGTNGIVPVGTTGESPTLSHAEHKRVVEIVVDETAGRVPVIAGAGSNNTREAIEFAQHAEKAGADAVLTVAPYYNKPSQEGMYQHFKAIADSISIPVFLYNVPSRTVANISIETVDRLAKDCANVVGIKDATANLARPSQQRHLTGPDFIQVSGEDATALGFNAHGGVGCISVTANVAPRLCSQFQAATAKGDFELALTIQDRLMPLHDAMFAEPSPGPVKYGVSLLGHCSDEVRLPVTTISDACKTQVKDAMVFAGLLN
ncbi:4-hydroxy-tetrahydrodipicolinate synthase [hydrothermal vent metagenome]|uniref:4-hydroxy-tetrahydrodipicolinate synthase n=1 Tax=hydrothermal vent metagenome TaxID=652676 RepID=A0A3B0R2R5_9ZZZZ